jgi:hypothetical protein
MATKRVLAALEKVFAAEIEDRLPFQSRAKIYDDLCEEGLVQRMERILGTRWPALRVEGYALTQRGHMEFCMSCKDEPEPMP